MSRRHTFISRSVWDGNNLDPDGNPTLVGQDGSVASAVRMGPGHYRLTRDPDKGASWDEDESVFVPSVRATGGFTADYDVIDDNTVDVYIDDVGGVYGAADAEFSLVIFPIN